MTMAKIDQMTAINLDAVASIKFSGPDEELAAKVNFLTTVADGNFISETFTGEAARNLYEILGNSVIEEDLTEEREPESSAAAFDDEFLRTKSWFFVKGADGKRYFVAFINAKGSCSMRTFEAKTGRFIGKKYRAGNYQQQFADVIQKGVELTLDSQPNLERDCKVKLPESVLSQLNQQAK